MTLFSEETKTLETRNCTYCKVRPGRASYDETRNCVSCNGDIAFTEPDYRAILSAIKGRKGLRSKAPDYYGANYTRENKRSYYVWRMARFHGGEDVTMPITATTIVNGDPWIPELDKLADLVAKRVFGSNRAAAYRWAGALGYSVQVPDGMPASAYPGGPVVLDGNKPLEELAELLY
jgi:hypothetical protein